jgi:transaldolase
MTDCKLGRERGLAVRIFADGADLQDILESAADSSIAGFTTNPTLMRAAGVTNYKQFAASVIEAAGGRPVSFEVLADDFGEMERQAVEIASWGTNVNVKIPITNTSGKSAVPLVAELAAQGVVCNVTAMFGMQQVNEILEVLPSGAEIILSIFAGRIADTGVDPVPIMRQAVEATRSQPDVAILWASPREVLNIFQANELGVDIITCTRDLRVKMPIIGKDLGTYSRETVQMFFSDAEAAGYTL